MRVLHLCPLWHPVSPDSPGGIETFVASLIPALAKVGVESAIIAAGDSVTEAELIPACDKSLVGEMETGNAGEYAYYEQAQLALALRHETEFDVIHSHIGPGAYVLSAIPSLRHRVLHTIHSPVGSDTQWFVERHPEYLYSAVSELQARKLGEAGATHFNAIHNGIETTQFAFRGASGNGLLFIGRMEAVKGPDIAVRVARALGKPLTLAGPIVESAYFERRIAPFLDERITYVGVVDHSTKNELFGDAACALLPFRGEEPFGLVAIEAMACGTPVVSLARGAMPEIVEPGVTGYLSDNESDDDVAALVLLALKLDRAAIRTRVADRFDVSVSASLYAKLYAKGAKGRV